MLTLVPYRNSYKSVYMQLCITFFHNKLNNTIYMHIHTFMPANFYILCTYVCMCVYTYNVCMYVCMYAGADPALNLTGAKNENMH